MLPELRADDAAEKLVCTGCGRVVEFVSPGIAALQGEICRAHGFVPTRHALQIAGLCNACSQVAAQTGQAAAASPQSPGRAVHV